VLKIVILAGNAHNFNFSVNSYMLVKVACFKTFEEVMNGNNGTAVVAREEEKARRSKHGLLKNSQNKTSLKNAGGLGRSEPRNMDVDPMLNQATTRSRRNTSQRRYNEQRASKTTSRRNKRQERDDRMRITANYKYCQNTHIQFKARMVANFGEGFFYRGGSWHGEESRRYRTYHIKKAMQFLESNMQE